MDQSSLFDDGTPVECSYPKLSPLSGYRYGCRCPRCRTGKAAWRANPVTTCDCGAERDQRSRYCAACRDRRREDRRARGLDGARVPRLTADCEICTRSHGWFESMLRHHVRPELWELHRRVCKGCRHERRAQIARHRLSTDQALRLIRARNCELCGRFATLHVDHDHRHCNGPEGCAECVRGFICNACNADVAWYERTPPDRLAELQKWVQRDD